jgi:hypothetical protein
LAFFAVLALSTSLGVFLAFAGYLRYERRWAPKKGQSPINDHTVNEFEEDEEANTTTLFIALLIVALLAPLLGGWLGYIVVEVLAQR